MNWNELTLNPKVILGYFTQPPSLENVEIHQLRLSRDSATAEIVFEPAAFPERTSKKWPSGANTCQITLRAIEVSALYLSGWGSNIFGTLALSKEGSGLSISFEGPVNFKVSCSFADISQVSGYINARP